MEKRARLTKKAYTPANPARPTTTYQGNPTDTYPNLGSARSFVTANQSVGVLRGRSGPIPARRAQTPMGWEAWEPLIKDLRRWSSLRFQERARLAAIIFGWVFLVALALGFAIVLAVASWEAMNLGL